MKTFKGPTIKTGQYYLWRIAVLTLLVSIGCHRPGGAIDATYSKGNGFYVEKKLDFNFPLFEWSETESQRKTYGKLPN
ncbi:MAG: hypothetical protein WKF87_08125 [Chryseolinea sp.]